MSRVFPHVIHSLLRSSCLGTQLGSVHIAKQSPIFEPCQLMTMVFFTIVIMEEHEATSISSLHRPAGYHQFTLSMSLKRKVAAEPLSRNEPVYNPKTSLTVFQ